MRSIVLALVLYTANAEKPPKPPIPFYSGSITIKNASKKFIKVSFEERVRS